jgi:hypothetical protein
VSCFFQFVTALEGATADSISHPQHSPLPLVCRGSAAAAAASYVPKRNDSVPGSGVGHPVKVQEIIVTFKDAFDYVMCLVGSKAVGVRRASWRQPAVAESGAKSR